MQFTFSIIFTLLKAFFVLISSNNVISNRYKQFNVLQLIVIEIFIFVMSLFCQIFRKKISFDPLKIMQQWSSSGIPRNATIWKIVLLNRSYLVMAITKSSDQYLYLFVFHALLIDDLGGTLHAFNFLEHVENIYYYQITSQDRHLEYYFLLMRNINSRKEKTRKF